MKATLDIDDELYRQLKSTAALRGIKIRELIAEGARMVLREPVTAYSTGKKIELPLIRSKRKNPLDIPDDIASRSEVEADLERYAASLRQ